MKKRTRNILILLVGLVLIGCVVVLLTISEKTDDTSEIIEHKINKIRNENRAAKFSELTPFDWDKAFILEDPFYDQEKIDEIVGVNCNLNRLETDINRRIVFVNDGKFVFDYIYDVREYRYSPSGTITLNNNSTIHTEYEGSSKVIVLNVEPYCCAVLLVLWRCAREVVF